VSAAKCIGISVGLGDESVEIVARHVALELRKHRFDRGGFLVDNSAKHFVNSVDCGPVRIGPRTKLTDRYFAEPFDGAVCEDSARLNGCLSSVATNGLNFVHMSREIEENRLVDRLPSEARGAASWQNRYPLGRAVVDDVHNISRRPRDDNPDRDDLIGARVCRVQLTRILIEPNLSSNTLTERRDKFRPIDTTPSMAVLGPRVHSRVVRTKIPPRVVRY
jgi:hypothetical protein